MESSEAVYSLEEKTKEVSRLSRTIREREEELGTDIIFYFVKKRGLSKFYKSESIRLGYPLSLKSSNCCELCYIFTTKRTKTELLSHRNSYMSHRYPKKGYKRSGES